MLESYRRRLGWSVTLFLLWLLLSQSFHWQSIITGLIIALVVSSINVDLLVGVSGDMNVNFRTIRAWLAYFAFLVMDIFTAAWQVAKLAFSPNPKLQSDFVYHNSELSQPLMRVLLATSITLTPGTLTVEADETGPFLVHVLTEEAAAGLEGWHIEARLVAIERKY